LEGNLPRVTLEFHPEEQSVRVYSRSNLSFAEPLAEDRVPLNAAVASTLGHLRRLWRETMPSAPSLDE
jgi:hypothetical protein